MFSGPKIKPSRRRHSGLRVRYPNPWRRAATVSPRIRSLLQFLYPRLVIGPRSDPGRWLSDPSKVEIGFSPTVGVHRSEGPIRITMSRSNDHVASHRTAPSQGRSDSKYVLSVYATPRPAGPQCSS